jgi:murein DD-endopeptidase MepM/ murein hydrolase activator NlpD
LTATLATGIGVASAATAAPADQPSSGGHTAAHASAALPIIPPAGDEAPGKAYPRSAAAGDDTGVGVVPAVPVMRKENPTRVVGPMSAPNSLNPDGAGAGWVHPNPAARVTSCFGPRWGRLHAGVDMAAPDGTPIAAASAGVIVRAGMAEGYGNAVLIDHGNGWLTHYGHLSRIAVTVGEVVQAGQQIGDEGSTGHSTGPHLHFEVHEGHYKNPVEPTLWMHQRGVDIPGCDTF